MYIGFVDDSGSTGSNTKDAQCPYQIVGGPIIESKLYTNLRTQLASIYADAIGFGPDSTDSDWIDAEFHANKMFHAKEEPYASIGQEGCWRFLQGALTLLAENQIPIIYGRIDKRSFHGTSLEDAVNPMQICCNLYFQSLTKWWVREDSPRTGWWDEPALLIADASHDDKKSAFRSCLQGAFKTCLKHLSARQDCLLSPSLSLFDDIYFGDSKQSVGLQLADIAMFFIHRRVNNNPDAEGFYNIIKPVLIEAIPFSLEGQANANITI